MNTIEIFILVLFISFFVIGCLGILICSNNTLYCFVYNHKDWKLWEHYIARIDEFVWNDKQYKFEIPNTDIRARIWENELCSIHWEDDCLCTFDTYHSKRMAKLLMAKIK